MRKLSKKELRVELDRLLTNSENNITLDQEDIKTIIECEGSIVMRVASYTGEKAAYEAMKLAVTPSLANLLSDDISGVLAHFHMHPKFPMLEITEAMEIIHESVDDDIDVIFATTDDRSIPINFIRITLIITGVEKEALKYINNVDFFPT